MKTRTVACVALLALVLGATAAFPISKGKLTFDVSFDFQAGDSKFSAGKYEISLGMPTQGDLTIRNLVSGNVAIVPTISRLASRNVGQPELVFDQAEGKMYLSELHVAPQIDGYYLGGAKSEHGHKVLKGSESK